MRRADGARVAFLYAFDFLEHYGQDLREQSLLARRQALGHLLRRSPDGIVFNEHIQEEGAVVFAHACRLGAEGIVPNPYDIWASLNRVRNLSPRLGLPRGGDEELAIQRHL